MAPVRGMPEVTHLFMNPVSFCRFPAVVGFAALMWYPPDSPRACAGRLLISGQIIPNAALCPSYYRQIRKPTDPTGVDD